MRNLNLDQFKTETKSTNEKGARLSLEQFKAKTANNENNEELEKLTGGILGACHSWWDQVKDALKKASPNLSTSTAEFFK